MLMGGTSYILTVTQEAPNDCMVDIIWTMLTFGIKPLTYRWLSNQRLYFKKVYFIFIFEIGYLCLKTNMAFGIILIQTFYGMV